MQLPPAAARSIPPPTLPLSPHLRLLSTTLAVPGPEGDLPCITVIYGEFILCLFVLGDNNSCKWAARAILGSGFDHYAIDREKSY